MSGVGEINENLSESTGKTEIMKRQLLMTSEDFNDKVKWDDTKEFDEVQRKYNFSLNIYEMKVKKYTSIFKVND